MRHQFCQQLLGLTLQADEVEGVLAHEIAHVRNRDKLVMAIAATLAGALSTFANMAMRAGMLGGNRSEGDEECQPGPFAIRAGCEKTECGITIWP
jgi:Zn-dependent protease with chaperone function